jgi:hypothetical protein
MGRVEGGRKRRGQTSSNFFTADKMIVAVMGAIFNLIFAPRALSSTLGCGSRDCQVDQPSFVAEEIRTADGAIVSGPALRSRYPAKVTLFTHFDGKSVPDWWYFQNAIATSVGKEDGEAGRRQVEVGILRDGENMVFTVYPELVSSERMRYIGIEPETDETSAPIVIHLEPDMPAIESRTRADGSPNQN